MSTSEARRSGGARTERQVCPRCQADLSQNAFYQRFHVCESCRLHFAISARRRIELVVDAGSFREVNQGLETNDPLGFNDRMPYRERLAQTRERTGVEESAITGIGTVSGRSAVISVSEFEFMGGSMGTVKGEKVALAIELAAKQRLPFISIEASGGARMQEGMLSLVQMAKTASATMRLKQAGVPFISVLTDPTTGGVYASYASLGDVNLAEPDALIGFAGPRVIEQLTGSPPPERAQTAEFLFEHGWVDSVVERPRLRNLLATLLQLFDTARQAPAKGESDLYRPAPRPPREAWEAVGLARHERRPTARYYIHQMLPNFVELHGDRLSADDPAVICGIGDLSGFTTVVIGQERGDLSDREYRRGGRMRPEGYRKAIRMMRLAAQLRLPLLTLIDTPGAALDFDSEARGLAPSIASALAAMSILPVPLVAAVIGEGGSGGALALGLADRILMQENAIYSVIAPEGAAAILYRDAERARDLAEALKLTAVDCSLLGVVDTVVPEPESGAHEDPAYAALVLRNFILDTFTELRKVGTGKLVDERYRKFRRMGQILPPSRGGGGVGRDVHEVQRRIARAIDQVIDLLPARARSEDPEHAGTVEPPAATSLPADGDR
ncbi:MAG: acetyl-CoA carboxylase, carboxyltransferase subunit beta [Chloroflexi bacterium]|nr:acetyl-CoA carboxylase, carboxyltransferase subunit beta [Chloroflexota bacterium]